MATGSFLLKRDSGQVEVSKSSDLFNADQLSYLAALAQTTPNRTFNLSAGRIFIDENTPITIADTLIDMGIGGLFQTLAINATFYNIAYFTIDNIGTIKKYEGTSAAIIGNINAPIIPENEVPVCSILFQDDGSGLAGSITPIIQSNITDKRIWHNLGNLDNTAFKLIYNNANSFVIQKGSAWFNNSYLTLTSNLTKAATISPDSTYYVYLDYNNASGGVSASSFSIMIYAPESGNVNLRRYTPIGTYSVVSGEIQRTSLVPYKAKYWQYRDSPYVNIETQTSSGTTLFTISSFTFLDDDPLHIDINGITYYEGATNDWTRTTPNQITFNFNVGNNAEVTFKKL